MAFRFETASERWSWYKDSAEHPNFNPYLEIADPSGIWGKDTDKFPYPGSTSKPGEQSYGQLFYPYSDQSVAEDIYVEKLRNRVKEIVPGSIKEDVGHMSKEELKRLFNHFHQYEADL